MSDYEGRFRTIVRRVEKALLAVSATKKMPSEVYGWFLLNIFMKLDPSDAANVKGKATSYALDDVLSALNTMWSGGSLALRDAEHRRRRKENGSYLTEETPETEIYQTGEKDWTVDEESQDAVEGDALTWYQEAKAALIEEPDDELVLANFKEARRALDQARTARGYYPVRNPNYPKNDQKGSPSGKGMGKMGDYSDKICMRCGKKGHIARICPQRPAQGKGQGRGSDNHFAGFVGFAIDLAMEDEDAELNEWEMEEDLDQIFFDDNKSPIHVVCSVSDDTGEQIYESGPGGTVYAATGRARGCAIIDSGASENIIGEDTLQELADHLQELDFDPMAEIEIDRRIHKQFTYGNNLTSAGLGLSHVNAGIFGQQVEVQAHMVEGATPFLLSAKFLYDMEATINFRTGVALFKRLSPEQFRLERSASNHLLLPMTAFAGREAVLEGLRVDAVDEAVAQVSSEIGSEALSVQTESEKGDPKIEDDTSPPQ